MRKGNLVVMTGNLGFNPKEFRTSKDDIGVEFSINIGKGKNSNPDADEWYKVIAFGKAAEYCLEYAKKGSRIMVTGYIEQTKYLDKENKERRSIKVVANELELSRSAEKAETKDTGVSDEVLDAL